ncbi:hypothetical protein ACIQOW_24740 [Kitasatospora sp. NPDC091335]
MSQILALQGLRSEDDVTFAAAKYSYISSSFHNFTITHVAEEETA